MTSTTVAAHLWAYKRTVSIPSTSNINLVPGDGISNTTVTPTACVSSANRVRVKKNTSTSGTVTVQVLQHGYFN